MRLALALVAVMTVPALAVADEAKNEAKNEAKHAADVAREIRALRTVLRNLDPLLARDVVPPTLSTLGPAAPVVPDTSAEDHSTDQVEKQTSWYLDYHDVAPIDVPRSKLEVGPVAVVTRDTQPEEIERVIEANVRTFLACRNPLFLGSMNVAFDIGADGGVTRAVIASSSITAPHVERCVIRSIMRLKFAGRRVVASVRYPFTFLP